jgi:hypothetical protein
MCSAALPGTSQRLQAKGLHDAGVTTDMLFVGAFVLAAPADPTKTLGIKLPFLVMIIKNLKKYFSFEVQVLDDKNVRRRFRASNYQSTTRVKPFICTMPMRLDDGWNQIQFNLSDFTRRAYGEVVRLEAMASCSWSLPWIDGDMQALNYMHTCPCTCHYSHLYRYQLH